MVRLEKLLRPFFDKYDDDHSGDLDIGEFWSVFHDLQEHVNTPVSISQCQKQLHVVFGDATWDEVLLGVHSPHPETPSHFDATKHAQGFLRQW